MSGWTKLELKKTGQIDSELSANTIGLEYCDGLVLSWNVLLANIGSSWILDEDTVQQ